MAVASSNSKQAFTSYVRGDSRIPATRPIQLVGADRAGQGAFAGQQSGSELQHPSQDEEQEPPRAAGRAVRSGAPRHHRPSAHPPQPRSPGGKSQSVSLQKDQINGCFPSLLVRSTRKCVNERGYSVIYRYTRCMRPCGRPRASGKQIQPTAAFDNGRWLRNIH